MTELRTEYQDAVKVISKCYDGLGKKLSLEGLAIRLQELADRPRVQLTDEEIMQAWGNGGTCAMSNIQRAALMRVIAAYDAKQTEPKTEKVVIHVWRNTKTKEIYTCDFICVKPWPWMWIETIEREYPL